MADKILNVKIAQEADAVLKKRAKKRGCSKRFVAREILETDLIPHKNKP